MLKALTLISMLFLYIKDQGLELEVTVCRSSLAKFKELLRNKQTKNSSKNVLINLAPDLISRKQFTTI